METTRPFDPLSDLFARALLGDEKNTSLLTNFINAFLTPKKLGPVTSVDILNPYNLKEYFSDRETILDVKARDSRNRIINVEIQISTGKYFANRSLLYWAKNYQSQLRESEAYSRLNPVICINLVGEPLFPQLEEYHTCFQLTEMDHPEQILTDHLYIMFMELSKMTFPDEAHLAIGSDFERWCYFFKYEGYLKEDEMPVLLGDNPYIQEAHKLYTTFTADQAMLDRLEAKEKWRRDYLSGLDESWNDGREKGREEGIAQTVKDFKAAGVSIDIIIKATGLSEEEIQKL